MLAEVFGRPVPEPVATAVTSWTSDPYTHGAYTQCPPGADPSMFDALGEPAHGRLLFAGEHTSRARSGYADGAYVSGLRAGQLLASGVNSTELRARPCSVPIFLVDICMHWPGSTVVNAPRRRDR
ncbi:monoamine oxidase [Mycobacterium sp. URHB0021]